MGRVFLFLLARRGGRIGGGGGGERVGLMVWMNKGLVLRDGYCKSGEESVGFDIRVRVRLVGVRMESNRYNRWGTVAGLSCHGCLRSCLP